MEIETYKISTDYVVISDTDKETRIKEIETHTLNDFANNYVREIAIKKDNAILNTWFNNLRDDELLKIDLILKTIMQERGLM